MFYLQPTVTCRSNLEKTLPMARQGRPAKRLLTKFPNRIRELREALELTQEDLAETVHMSTSNVGKIERGEIDLIVPQLPMFARALRCHPTEILPDSMRLSPNHKQLISLFDHLSPVNQRALLKMASSLQEDDPDRRAAG